MKEVVHHEEIPGQSTSKEKNSSDKKSNYTIKAKSIPVTPKTVASSLFRGRDAREMVSYSVDLQRD